MIIGYLDPWGGIPRLFVAPMRVQVPVVSIVVPFWGYLIGSLLCIWLNQKKELQWRLEVVL